MTQAARVTKVSRTNCNNPSNAGGVVRESTSPSDVGPAAGGGTPGPCGKLPQPGSKAGMNTKQNIPSCKTVPQASQAHPRNTLLKPRRRTSIARTAFKLFKRRQNISHVVSLKARLDRLAVEAYGSGRRGKRRPCLLKLRDDLRVSASNGLDKMQEENLYYYQDNSPTNSNFVPKPAFQEKSLLSDKVDHHGITSGKRPISYFNNTPSNPQDSANDSPGFSAPRIHNSVSFDRSTLWEHTVSPIEKYYTRQTPLKVEPRMSSVRSQPTPQLQQNVRMDLRKTETQRLEQVIEIMSQEYPKLARDLLPHIANASGIPKPATLSSPYPLRQTIKSENSPHEELAMDREQVSLLSDQNSPLAVLDYLSHAPGQTVKEYLMATRRYFQDRMEMHRREMDRCRKSVILCEKKLEGLL